MNRHLQQPESRSSPADPTLIPGDCCAKDTLARLGMPTDPSSRYHPPMCGRFTQHYTWREICELYGLVGAARNLEPRYNVCPTDQIDAVRSGAGGRALVTMRWGLVPSWWKKSLKELPATFNARAETVADKPMFRAAYRQGRCLIPASGYFEWKTMPDGKQPYLFSSADGSVLTMAGLCEEWRHVETGDRVLSATVIITGANAFVRQVHDRMPVLLDRNDFEPWLSGAAGTELLKPAPDGLLDVWPVSRRVNKAGEGGDDRSLIERVAI